MLFRSPIARFDGLQRYQSGSEKRCLRSDFQTLAAHKPATGNQSRRQSTNPPCAPQRMGNARNGPRRICFCAQGCACSASRTHEQELNRFPRCHASPRTPSPKRPRHTAAQPWQIQQPLTRLPLRFREQIQDSKNTDPDRLEIEVREPEGSVGSVGSVVINRFLRACSCVGVADGRAPGDWSPGNPPTGSLESSPGSSRASNRTGGQMCVSWFQHRGPLGPGGPAGGTRPGPGKPIKVQ